MASSSDSSDEDLEKFAAIADIVDSEVTKSPKLKCNGNFQESSKLHPKPSLRHWREDEDTASSTSELITPEFRHHVAKKLSKFLDSNYICTQDAGHLQNGQHNSSHESTGIKLLLTSNKKLLDESLQEFPSHTTCRKNTTNYSSSSGSDTDEEELSRLAEAAVSGHSIIQKVSNGSKEEDEGETIETSGKKRKKEKKRKREKKEKEKLDEVEVQKKKIRNKHKKEKQKS